MATYLPSKDSLLLAWSGNWAALISLSPETYGLTALQATNYQTLHDAFADAWAVTQGPGRGPVATQTKNDAKDALIRGDGGIRELVAIVQAFPGTTDTMRAQLRITISDDEPSPVPVPSEPPNISLEWTMGRVVQVRLKDQENPDRRGKPDGVQGATLLYHVGESAPDDPTQWIFLKNTSKTIFNVNIPLSVTAGSKVWLTALWFNARKESSPAAMPESTRIADQLSQAA